MFHHVSGHRIFHPKQVCFVSSNFGVEIDPIDLSLILVSA